jgi:uncharacterized CHY-type Zn-finger protein
MMKIPSVMPDIISVSTDHITNSHFKVVKIHKYIHNMAPATESSIHREKDLVICLQCKKELSEIEQVDYSSER